MVEPFAPAFAVGDALFGAAVTHVVTALIRAEELGITGAEAATARSAGPAAQRLLGPTPGIAKTLGMPDGWAARAITKVGNYGELFERAVGQRPRFRFPRGPNARWSDGGMIYALPIR